MSALFLSHSSHDQAAAVRLKEALLGLGFAEVFIDTHSIQPGQKWELVLYEQLKACRAVVVLLSPRFIASQWCFAEVTQARALGRPILPVRLEACELPVFLQEYQVEDFADLSSTTLERLREGLARADVLPGDRPEWDRRRPPYPGLASFEVEDAGVYFGRDRDIQAGLDRLHDMALFGGDCSLLILGASGAGKSSLLRAGLTDRLLRRPQHWCVVGPMRPREEPFTQLARAVYLACSRSGGAQADEAEVRESLKDGVAPLRALLPLRSLQYPDARFVLVMDQLEELLMADEAECKAFLTWLARALTLPQHPLLLLGSLRSDHLADLERVAPFAIPGRGYLSLQPIPVEQLRLSISRPAEGAGVPFEDGLADTLLEDVRERQALPLLAFTLRELWDRREPGARLTRHSYAYDIGGVQGAIRRAAEAASGGARQDEHWKGLRRVLLRMVQVESDGRVLRRRMRTSEVPAQVRAQIAALVRARLLVVDEDFVEPAHEALFSAWEKLHSAVTEAREALMVRTELESDATRWQREQCRPEYLWPRARLERATKLLQSAELDLDSTGQKFAESSWEKMRQEEALEARRKQRETRFLRAVAVGLVALLSVILALAARAWTQQQRAESRELTTSAFFSTREDPQRALLLLQEAARHSTPERFPEVMDAWSRGPFRLVLRGHTDSVYSAAFSPDGSRIFTVSHDHTARVWDAATGKSLATLPAALSDNFLPPSDSWATSVRNAIESERRQAKVLAASFSPGGSLLVTTNVRYRTTEDSTPVVWAADLGLPIANLEGHNGGVVAASFSPHGSRIVTASRDHTARVWDAITGKSLATLVGHQGEVVAASFSPDGSRIVTVSSDHTARMWDAATGKFLATLEGHQGEVVAASFSPDGSLIVTVSSDHTARVWDAATGKFLATLEGHQGEVLAASFSPDSSRIVTASRDHTARVWGAATGKFLATLEEHQGEVLVASFSPDGSRIVTASRDHTARVWDAATGKSLATLEGHQGEVLAASFSPDGSRIVTASSDHTARVWGSAIGKPLATLEGHLGKVVAGSFSPDGSRLVITFSDNTARVWDAITGKSLATLVGHQGWVLAASFSPDGSRIVTASHDHTARVWDAATGKLLATLVGHEEEVRAASFSPDGSRIFTASYGDTARVWDAATGKLLATLVEHVGLVAAASFSPDGSRIVTSYSKIDPVHVLDTTTGKDVALLVGHEGQVVASSFSPDGARIVTASEDNTARVWDAATGKSLATLEGHQGAVLAVSFSPDGSRIVTASSDHTARVWDAATGKSLATLEGHRGEVLAASFSPDGSHIITASLDNTTRTWPKWRWDLEAFSKLDVGRELTCEERRDFLHQQLECPSTTQ